jgi:hypothetical protein
MHTRFFFSAMAALALLTPALNTAGAQAPPAPNACSLLSRAAIAQATGLHVARGQQGPALAGSLSDCTWVAQDGTRIVVTLADAAHMQVTLQSQLQSGATQYQGIGSNAAGTAGNDETGAGYNLSVLDAKGGLAVSIVGAAGTGERAVALAKSIEKHR